MLNDAIINISAYRFVSLPEHLLPEIKNDLLSKAKTLSLKGTILLSTEGINLFVAGLEDNISAFFHHLDNYKAFEGSDCAVLKQLVALLSSEDPQVLAIACNDIAEFVKVHPQGRKLMTQLGAKGPAMGVLKHPDTQAQKYALNCVQRLMVINWEYLSKA